MLQITYASADAAVAQRIRDELMASALKLERPMLVLLASPESLADETIMTQVQQARQQGHRIAVVTVRPVQVPADMGEFPPLDYTAGQPHRLVRYLNRVDLGTARIRRSRWLLLAVSAGALAMFFVAIWGIITGQVAFPQDEYATEYAFELGQIGTFAAPTLDYLMPRTTDDALNFPATAERAPTRVRIFAIETATALPQSLAATQQAIGTIAVATSAQLTLEAAVATPAP
jgi:hypothetical protein